MHLLRTLSAPLRRLVPALAVLREQQAHDGETLRAQLSSAADERSLLSLMAERPLPASLLCDALVRLAALVQDRPGPAHRTPASPDPHHTRAAPRPTPHL